MKSSTTDLQQSKTKSMKITQPLIGKVVQEEVKTSSS